MKYRSVDVLCDSQNADVVEKIIGECDLLRWWQASNDDQHNGYRLLVEQTKLQQVLDHLKETLFRLPNGQIIVQDVEAVYPESKRSDKEDQILYFGGITREELLNDVSGGAQLNLNYLLLLFLSTVVAAIGLMTGDLAAVIGAMVIAPMLSSYMAFSLGVTIGDISIIKKSLIVNLVGFVMVLIIASAIGAFWPHDSDSYNDVLLSRASVQYSHLALALAAGAAAVLSLTTGVSSALVGVMVSVALLPPLAASGLFIGYGNYERAGMAFLLAVANASCITVSSKLIFQLKNIVPDRGKDKKVATWSLLTSYGISIAMIFGVVAIIYYTKES